MNKTSLKLIGAVKSVIAEYDVALTLRQIYYRLVASQIIPNMQKYYIKLSRLCVKARDEGLLPESAFSDRLRQPQKPSSWHDLNEFLNTVKKSYRRDKWVTQSKYIEVWTEKDALRGVIQPITNEYGVTLLVVRGQVSRTAIYEAKERFIIAYRTGKEPHLLYFGDFDPSGLSIFNSLTERLNEMVDSVDCQRLALTPEQIKKHKLPQDPAKTTDPNYKSFTKKYGDAVVELDALPPDELQELIEQSISKFVSWSLRAREDKKEKQEINQLSKIIGGISKK